MPRFAFEADLRHHLEELVDRTITEIDDRRAPVIGNNAVEQRHLTARVGDIDRPDQVGEAGGERGLAGFKIVADQRSPAQPQEFNEKPRQQRFSNARVT
ncbi:MAG TPA: hypothetical protein VGV62_09665 [Xanthobacteraceae bacterium]|nr:hypothetical protein [Xanthobacteraceae bacterium]